MKNRGIHSKNYGRFLGGIRLLLERARGAAAHSINAVMTATYWEVGRRIVVFEQQGRKRAGYGEELLLKLSADLTKAMGRGFSRDNLELMRRFYLCRPLNEISETVSRKSGMPSGRRIPQAVSAESGFVKMAKEFPLSWSHYSRLLRVKAPQARTFYEAESLRGGWSIRQLDRQIV